MDNENFDLEDSICQRCEERKARKKMNPIARKQIAEIEKFIEHFSKSLRLLLVNFGESNCPSVSTKEKHILKISINENIHYLNKTLEQFRQDFKK